MPEPLQPGDRYSCPRCHQVHVVELPYADRSTAERLHLYVTCRDQRYFVGQLPAVDLSRIPVGPTIVTARRVPTACPQCGGARWVCEEHPDRPWPHDDCAGPGVPCPGCNDSGGRPALPPNWTAQP